MKTNDNDKLKSLFQEMKLDEPSVGFESRLMQQIHIVAAEKSRQEVRTNKVQTILAIIGGIAGILGIPAFIFWLLGWSFKTDIQLIKHDFTFSMPYLKLDPFIVTIACVILLLLVSDTLIRKRIGENKHKH